MKQWKRLLSLVLAASLVFSMGIVLPEVQADSSSAPVETTWDFANADGWSLGRGYAVSDGKLVWQTVGSQNSGTSAYLGNTDAVAWTNYTLSADITATYNNSANQNQHAMAGLNFYVSDSDSIQIRVRPATVANKFSVEVRENGTSLGSKTAVVGADSSVNKETRSFNLKADMHYDGKLTVYINDTEVWTGTAASPSGKPGVTAWASAGGATTTDTVTFDNVKVTPLAASVITPEADYSGTVLGWSDGSADLGEDWTVTGTYTAENGVLKATTGDDFFAKVGSAVQHGYIEADVTLPAKSEFTATSNKSLGYINATVGANQVYTLRLFWQQTSKSTTLHDGTLYADLFIDDSVKGYNQGEDVPHYGGAGQGTRISFKLKDENWGKTYTLRLARIGNFVEAKFIDKESNTVLKTWQYALNPAYSIVTGAMTLGFGADVKDSGCNVTFDNIIAASIAANAVSAGELDMEIDAYAEMCPGLDDAAQKIDAFYRTAYAPGETVTVKLESAAAWDLETLRYVTATNTAGTKLVATADDKVYTFVMPAEAVTLAGESATGEVIIPAYELLYDMAATPNANSTTGWRANATAVAGKGVCVKPATDLNGITNYYNTGVVSGWIKADITLPTISEDALKTNAANTGDIWYGLSMARGDGVNIDSAKYIDAAIWYQRNTGTTEAAPKIGKTYLRIRFSGTGYDAANLLEVSLPNTLWTTGATVSMEMRKVGNYILVKVSCDTIPEANQIAFCTVDFNTFAGGKDGTWKFGLKADNPLLYTDWTKAEQVQAEAYFNNVEIGNILRTVSVNIDSAAAGKVSLPEVNEFKGAALARDAYEVGEVLKLTVADDADLTYLHYTADENSERVDITAPEAFQVPDAETVNIAYGKAQEITNQVLYTNDGTAALDADLWSPAVSLTNGKLVLVTDMDTKNANKTAYFGTAVADGWIKADITLPTITVDQMVANNGASGNIGTGDTANLFYGFYMQDATNTGNAIEAAIFYQRNGGTTAADQYSKLRVRVTGSGYNATNIAEVKLPNAIWNSSKPVTLKLRTVGNYIEAVLIADGVSYVVAGTAATTTVAGDNTTAWKFGLYTNVGMMYTDTTKATKLDRTASFSNIEIGQINKVVAVNIDADAADKVSLPKVNEIGKTTALDRTGYQVGEVLKLTVTDGAEIYANGEQITDTDAFEIPNADSVELTCAAEQPSEPPLVSATYNGGEYDATKWTATGSSVYVSEPFANGYVEAEFAISGTISNAANMFVRSPKTAAGVLFGQEEEIMLRWTVVADSSQAGYTHKATSTLVIRDYATPGYHLESNNAIHGKAATVYLNIQEGAPAILKVKMEVVSNLLRIYVNGELHQEATFDPQYSIASQAGYFGYYGLSDNAKVSKATVQEVQVYAVTTPDSMTADETAHLIKPYSTYGASFGRTAYAAGETVTIMVNNTTGLDLTTLRYTTATNAEGVKLTATAIPGIYTFTMPAEDVTVVCDAEQIKELISATYNGGEYDATKWTATGNSAYVSEPFANGYIEAEFAISGDIKNAANMFVRSPKTAAGVLFGQEEEIMLRWTVVADASQAGYTHKATSSLVIRDYATPGYHLESNNAIHGKAATVYLNIQEGTPAILKVKMEVVGNLLRIYVNGELHQEATFDPQYSIASQAGYFGYYGLSDNAKVSKATVQEVQIYAVTTPDSMTADETEHLVKPHGRYGASFGRTAYAAGETVTIMVNNTTGLDLTTLRYTTATNAEGVKLTATAIPGIYTFVMPQEDVTVVCDEIVITEPSEVVAEINGDANLDADLWTVTGAYTADGTINTTANNFKAVLTGKYQHFTMEADITIPAKPADLSANMTLATMVATVGSNQAYTFRFFWQNSVNTFYFDLFLNDANNALAPSIYGGAADGGRLGTALSDSHWGKTYTVKASRIGNYLAYSVVETGTDNVIVDAYYNLNPNYTITTGQVEFSLSADGSKGAVAFDNVKITSYNVKTVDKGEMAVSLDPAKEHTGGKDGSGIEEFERTHYAAGETVTVIVDDPSGMDLASLRYVSASNPTGVTLTATNDPLVFTFVMPNENVTLAVDEGEGLPIVPKPEGQILKENFDTVANGTTADKIFKDMNVQSGAANAKAQNGALVLNNAFGMHTNDTYLHGYIQADFTFVKPQDALESATTTTTKYGGNLSAKWGGVGSNNCELRTRFMVVRNPGAEQEYTVKLQVIMYSYQEYGHAPIYGTDIPLTNFQWGNTYNVKLSVIGNYFTVHLDGALAGFYTLDPESTIASFPGRFGMAHVVNTFELAVDNVEIQSYKAYAVSFDDTMADVLKTDAYSAIKGGKVTPRTHFLENEFVKLHVSAPAGYGIDDATIKYTGATCGDVAITAKDSATLYGFRMPAEDVTVTAALTEAETDTKPINDTFDVESLMVDRGWGKEFKILDGKARAYGHTESYLNGIAGVNSWKSYTVSAKITMVETTGSSTGVAALCVRAESTAEGYEYGLTFNAGADKGALRLYDRTNGKLLYTGEKELKAGVEYTLTLVVKGNQISGYLNGAWRFTVYVEDTVGGVGVRAQAVNAIFDDVKVTDIVA